jgi:hypothetical protein
MAGEVTPFMRNPKPMDMRNQKTGVLVRETYAGPSLPPTPAKKKWLRDACGDRRHTPNAPQATYANHENLSYK